MFFPTKSYIKSLSVRPKKQRGQNFLIDQQCAAKAFSFAGIEPDSLVIEIGPGPGSLTFFVNEIGAAAVCFEVDEHLWQILSERIPSESAISIVNKDILAVDFNEYIQEADPQILIGSIPYSITTPILLSFFRNSRLFKRALFIMQKEVAERLCAVPGTKDYGVLSLYARAYMDTNIHMLIQPDSFHPRPKVSSAVVSMVPQTKRSWNDPGEDLFQKVVRAAFSQRRKKLSNCIKGFLRSQSIDGAEINSACESKGIDLMRRAETLHVDEFDCLTEIIAKAMKNK